MGASPVRLDSLEKFSEIGLEMLNYLSNSYEVNLQDYFVEKEQEMVVLLQQEGSSIFSKRSHNRLLNSVCLLVHDFCWLHGFDFYCGIFPHFLIIVGCEIYVLGYLFYGFCHGSFSFSCAFFYPLGLDFLEIFPCLLNVRLLGLFW